MKSRISALMDGELDANELDEPLRALRDEGEAREAWRTIT
jgi:negative regulator of sigma E activity